MTGQQTERFSFVCLGVEFPEMEMTHVRIETDAVSNSRMKLFMLSADESMTINGNNLVDRTHGRSRIQVTRWESRPCCVAFS